jgi:hypothetical protein
MALTTCGSRPPCERVDLKVADRDAQSRPFTADAAEHDGSDIYFSEAHAHQIEQTYVRVRHQGLDIEIDELPDDHEHDQREQDGDDPDDNPSLLWHVRSTMRGPGPDSAARSPAP